MKKFILSVLCVSVFFAGLGALVERAGARFKSDERSVAIIAKARRAIGGDAAIAEVRSMVINGQTMHTLKIDGVEKTHTGETEIAMQLPDKMMKMIKISGGAGGGEAAIDRQVDVIVVGGDKQPVKLRTEGGDSTGQVKVMVHEEDNGSGPVRKVTIKKADGTVQELTGAEADKFIAQHSNPGGDNVRSVVIKKGDRTVEATSEVGENAKTVKLDGKTAYVRTTDGHGAARQNEMLRTTLSLLLTAPQGIDVEYTYGGESSVDGTQCDIVIAAFGGSSYKLFISRSSSLPVAMGYTGHRMPRTLKFKHAAPGDAAKEKDVRVFTHRVDAPGEPAEFMVKFTDYRTTGGVQLPYRWTTSVGDKIDETFEVTSYDINPANIADRFQDQKVMIRTKRPESN